ncbi:MAG: DNA polymerase III subunit delta' [Microbacteriaceae bacterium]|nr:DNA polymerase III subunit delta' [Microbacteriaceae bacterium]
MTSLWADLVGHDSVITQMQNAADSPDTLTQSWLITGPAGSGRSLIARAFAAQLLGDGEDSDSVDRQVRALTHPDLTVLATERVLIPIDEVRQLVETSYRSPVASSWRIIIIEDADRMAERTSNVLLKALEEPAARTIWILCAPSEADVIPTIRSRVRSVRIGVPAIADIAAMLVERDGVDPAIAEQSARHAQSHIGMARRLATSTDARERRARSLSLVLGIQLVSDAVNTAAEIVSLATDDAKALTEVRDDTERSQFLQSLGLAPGEAVPLGLRPQLKVLEENQKRRATRSLRDGVDRVLTDLESLFRDVLVVALGGNVPLTNSEFHTEIASWLERHDAAHAVNLLDAIETARRRMERNVTPLLALEALFVETSGVARA